ncbi:hypothetical protein AJ78_01855 [Emergomyces pasteurianus Ep9510]|uniref:Ribonuclease H2 subunit B n=1 Tax=Emergomyces pasteurianus Ep9510 TaxID=1447872 RepID=A0A1J9QD14_9EURO|nr:hypothetical protein AJ78_01855 [Emergomyces pasteurianus Ep9510]
MRTRSTPSRTDTESQETSTPALPIPSKPTKTLILPRNATEYARFVLLENPRTSTLSRYYFCPKLGLYEFTTISSSASIPRSILFTTTTAKHIASSVTEKQGDNAQNISGNMAVGDGSAEKKELIQQVVEDQAPNKAAIAKHAQLLVATPVDILFFLLPILAPTRGSSTSRQHFQPLDDMLDSQDTLSRTLKHILASTFREKVEARMTVVCDTIEAGQTMYRLNEDKLLQELVSKAERIVAHGFPPSLEERFIQRALEVPVLSVKRNDFPATSMSSNLSEMTGNTNNIPETSRDMSESQPSSSTTPTTPSASFSLSNVSTPNTEIMPPIQNSPLNCDVHQLLRVRTAMAFIQSSYLSKHLSSRVETLLNSPEMSPKDFSPLTQHLKLVAELRAKAHASRSMGDFSRKRDVEDDEAAEIRAEKKRRKEEEEKKKKMGESRAVRDLKKVNVSGMKKLSAFFGKKT